MTAFENQNTCMITHIRATDAHDAINLPNDAEGYIPCPKECTMIMLSLNTVPEVCAIVTSWEESTNVQSIAWATGLFNRQGKRLHMWKPLNIPSANQSRLPVPLI